MVHCNCCLYGEAGITPEFKSFKDDGFGPLPAKWKGSCGHYANFSGCNKYNTYPCSHCVIAFSHNVYSNQWLP